MHKRVPVAVYLHPDLYDWVRQEAALKHVSISEIVSRLIAQQYDLRKQLSALTETKDESTPVFQVLLEQHGEKVVRTIDGAVKQMESIVAGMDLLKTMAVFHAKMVLDPPRFSQWEKDVQATIGRKK